MLSMAELKEGMILPEIIKRISQENINLYAEASRDFNPIHIDAAYAKKTPLGGTIAHGMLTLAYISQMMTAAFGLSWVSNGKLNIRFKAPTRPGDTITVSGQICGMQKDEGQSLIDCEVSCKNQNGEPIIIGKAKVKLKTNDNSRGFTKHNG